MQCGELEQENPNQNIAWLVEKKRKLVEKNKTKIQEKFECDFPGLKLRLSFVG